MRRLAFGAGVIAAVVALTVVTQLGGLVLVALLPLLTRIRRRAPRSGTTLAIAALLAGYLACVFAVAPLVALISGRVPLPIVASADAPLRPATLLMVLLMRSYTRPALRDVALDAARALARAHPGSELRYLDGAFPAWDRFPLLPHLSHRDARRLDLAFLYRDRVTGEALAGSPSLVGYWIYESPREGEPRPCAGRSGWLRWDFDWLQPLFAGVEVDATRTAFLLRHLASDSRVSRVLLEPHLRQRLRLDGDKIRLQGCDAARHDDHLHVEIPAG
jgi:hypothetical protein